MTLSVIEAYRQLAKAPGFAPDPAQEALALKLDALAKQLAAPKPNGLSRLFAPPPPEPRGLYIWGAVGRGKTLLMDLFFSLAEVTPKKRMHAHAFMADVHARLHAWRQAAKRGEVSGGDPVPPIAKEIAAEARLLCFDEFSVRDIADAMILSRLFAGLFAAGVVVVATSNVAPDDLYKDGLNRASFLPFIKLVHDKMDVVELAARTDFRLEKLGRAPVYWTPDDAAATAALTRAFADLSGHEQGAPTELQRAGRVLLVPCAAHGVARFGFDDLCRAPLYAPDYLAIAERFHTVLIDHIPGSDNNTVRSKGPGEQVKVCRSLGGVEVHENHIDTGRSKHLSPDIHTKHIRCISNRNTLIGKDCGIDDSRAAVGVVEHVNLGIKQRPIWVIESRIPGWMQYPFP